MRLEENGEDDILDGNNHSNSGSIVDVNLPKLPKSKNQRTTSFAYQMISIGGQGVYSDDANHETCYKPSGNGTSTTVSVQIIK